jgi:hypothetical protein
LKKYFSRQGFPDFSPEKPGINFTKNWRSAIMLNYKIGIKTPIIIYSLALWAGKSEEQYAQ